MRRVLFSELTGELVNNSEEENLGNHFTPPDQNANAIHPCFGNVLKVPDELTIRYVKNKREAILFGDVAQVGCRLDILTKHLIQEMKQLQMLENTQTVLIRTGKTLSWTLLPLLGITLDQTRANIKTVKDEFSIQFQCLLRHKLTLEQYIEVHRSLIPELQLENCQQLAKDKLLLATVEELLLQRITSIFEKRPYSSANRSWDSIVTEHKQNALPARSDNQDGTDEARSKRSPPENQDLTAQKKQPLKKKLNTQTSNAEVMLNGIPTSSPSFTPSPIVPSKSTESAIELQEDPHSFTQG
eukprot:TRINITY_DN5840_c0_g2_i1.p1 TRINITY_DN5840_c0_g2~~TRINITY_DN5840_c0_g2_i1.p1  ORF type:complete len:299 (-),score=70.05 TRINITY_DN5840_c0_g2_i1:355-1251(-)